VGANGWLGAWLVGDSALFETLAEKAELQCARDWRAGISPMRCRDTMSGHKLAARQRLRSQGVAASCVGLMRDNGGVNFQVYFLAVYVAMRPDNAEQGQHAGRVRLAPFAKLPRGGGRRSWLPT